jgi:hypothetical protein
VEGLTATRQEKDPKREGPKRWARILKKILGMNEGTFGHEGVKSCSNGGSRWQGKGLQDPSEWSKFKPVFLSVCVCSFQEEAKCPYFTYLFCKILLRSELEDENFILNPSSTKTTTYFFAITIRWAILFCISILFPG